MTTVATAPLPAPVHCALCLCDLDRWYLSIRAPMCVWCHDRQGPVQNPWLWELKADRVSPAARAVWESWATPLAA